MDLQHGGNGSTNGDSTPAGHNYPEAQHAPQAGFIEDGAGTTIESRAAVSRFDTLHGGKLAAWQWRTIPPTEAVQPGGGRGQQFLELVDPAYGALIDHFLPLGTRPEEFQAGEHREFGDFIDGQYRSQAVNTGGEIRIGLRRDGEIRAGKRVAEVRMAKSAAMRPDSPDLAVLYRIINSSLRPLQILFAVEFNLFAPGLGKTVTFGDQPGYYLIDGEQPGDPALGSAGVSPNTTHLALVNPAGEMALQLGWDRESDLWRMPAPDNGPGVRILSVWRIQLPPRDNWAIGLWLAPA